MKRITHFDVNVLLKYNWKQILSILIKIKDIKVSRVLLTQERLKLNYRGPNSVGSTQYRLARDTTFLLSTKSYKSTEFYRQTR